MSSPLTRNIVTVLVRQADPAASFVCSIVLARVSVPFEYVSQYVHVFSEFAVFLLTTETVVSHSCWVADPVARRRPEELTWTLTDWAFDPQTVGK